MNSARQLASCTMPQEIDEPKTGKQKLWNSVITFLKKGGHVWRGSEVYNNGVAFVRTLVDTLWAINGHQDTLRSRSYPIPDIFSCFIGYNVPEQSKHRKRTIKNMKLIFMKKNSHAQMPFMCACKGITGPGATGMSSN